MKPCVGRVLNQVLVRFRLRSGDADAFTREVIRRIQADGTCWFGGTTWRGRAAARISISNASTTEADIDRSAARDPRVRPCGGRMRGAVQRHAAHSASRRR